MPKKSLFDVKVTNLPLSLCFFLSVSLTISLYLWHKENGQKASQFKVL